MEYKILRSLSARNLEIEVNHHLNEGWLLHGNLCMGIFNDDDVQFAQAMTYVKKDVDEPVNND